MLKASIEVIPAAKRESFLVKKFDRKGFLAPFHYHPEFELTFISEGKGKRFVGNNMSGFEKSDLVLVGPNTPHCWKLSGSKKEKAGSTVVHFNYNFLGKDFFASTRDEPYQKTINQK